MRHSVEVVFDSCFYIALFLSRCFWSSLIQYIYLQKCSSERLVLGVCIKVHAYYIFHANNFIGTVNIWQSYSSVFY